MIGRGTSHPPLVAVVSCGATGESLPKGLKWRLVLKEQRKKFATTTTVSLRAALLCTADALFGDMGQFALRKAAVYFTSLLTWHAS